ncbi:hypothetical protein GAG94_08595 [Lysinibacillus sphaericus]|nr:hypothetical protein GAG94_08595 [Lysinibacillus sphaericus]
MKVGKKAYLKKKISNRKFQRKGYLSYANIILIKQMKEAYKFNMSFVDTEESIKNNYSIDEIEQILEMDIEEGFKWHIKNEKDSIEFELDILNENINNSLELILGKDFKNSKGFKCLQYDVVLDILLDSIEVLDQLKDSEKFYYLSSENLQELVDILDETQLTNYSPCEIESYYKAIENIAEDASKISWKFSKMLSVFNLTLIYKTIGRKNRSYLNFEKAKEDFFFSNEKKSSKKIKESIINYRTQYTAFFKIVDVFVSSKNVNHTNDSSIDSSIQYLKDTTDLNLSLNIFALNRYSSLIDLILLEKYFYKNEIKRSKKRLEVLVRTRPSVMKDKYLYISNISKFKGLGIKKYLLKNKYNITFASNDINLYDIYNKIFDGVKKGLNNFLIRNYHNKYDDHFKNAYIIVEQLRAIDPYREFFIEEFINEQKYFDKPGKIFEGSDEDSKKKRKRKSTRLDNYIGIYNNIKNADM